MSDYITLEYIAERVFHRINPSTNEEVSKLYIYQIKSFIPQACHKLATQALTSHPAYREYMTISKTFSPSSGVYVINPNDYATPFENLIRMDSLPTSFINSEDNNWPWSYVPNVADLYYTPAGQDLIYYSTQNNIMHVREPSGDIDQRTLDVTINNAAGASAVNIQDGGNSITVDGTVTANAGTNLNTSLLALESTQTTQNTRIGDLTETAPASDTASSGLNGRLQRLAQRITSLIALLPTALISNRLDINLGAAPAVVTVTHGKTLKIVSGSLTVDTDIIAAVASKRIKVIAYSLVGVGTNSNTVIFKSNGTGGTELWRLLMQSSTAIAAGANLATSAPSFLFATVAGEKLTMDVSQADTIHYSVTYFDDDAT